MSLHMQIKRVLYRIGVRPKLGSIWYSPSLSYIYSWKKQEKNNWNLADSCGRSVGAVGSVALTETGITLTANMKTSVPMSESEPKALSIMDGRPPSEAS